MKSIKTSYDLQLAMTGKFSIFQRVDGKLNEITFTKFMFKSLWDIQKHIALGDLCYKEIDKIK